MCVQRWLRLSSLCLALAGCSNTSTQPLTPTTAHQSAKVVTGNVAPVTNPPPTKSAQRGHNKPTMFTTLVPIDLPVDPQSGGYKVCLREQDKVAWTQRGSASQPSTASLIAKALGGEQGSKLYRSLTKHSKYAGTVAGLSKSVSRSLGLEKAEAMCGNWCGPGHPKDPKTNPPPTDALDSACRSHDLCYQNKGYQSCACDQAFTQAVLRGRNRLQLNTIEQAMIVYFQSSYCTGGCKVVDGIRYCPGDLTKG